MKIPLFDIDWTLLKGGKDNDRPHHDTFDYVFNAVYGVPGASIREITPDGMIDTQIIVEIVKRHGISEEQAKAKMDEVVKIMSDYFLAHEADGRYVVLPGVRDLLIELKKRQVPPGLLTGNIEEIGWRKVTLGGIREFFCFGAFGDLAYKRADLIPIAVERAREVCHVEAPLTDFVIVGDSPLDVACAKAGGVQVIAVASGKFSWQELHEAGADLVVNSLEEQQKVLEFLNT